MAERYGVVGFPIVVRATAFGALLPGMFALGCGESLTRFDRPPTVVAITPALGPTTGAFTVAIAGTGLHDVSRVAVGGVESPFFTVKSDTLITAMLGDASGPGTVDVVVTSRTRGSGSCQGCFTYYDARLTVATVSPDTAPVGSVMAVTITGTGFVDVASVTIGGVELADRVVVSPTTITGTAAPHNDPGARDVVVTASGTARGACEGCFTYQLDVVARPLSAGGSHTCALAGDGTAYCWGDNRVGQLGDDSEIDRSIPVAVAGGYAFRAITAGEHHTCGLTASGTAYCWGRNAAGALGDGSDTTLSRVPVQVAGGLAFSTLTAGSDGAFTCGLSRSGAAYCWGSHFRGQLGIGSVTYEARSPTPVTGGITFHALDLGDHHACAVTTAGTIYCWGRNSDGVLGDGTMEDRNYPVRVSGTIAVEVVAIGLLHSCGLTSAGEAYCWGRLGLFGPSSTTPVALFATTRFTTLDTGGSHTCGIGAADAAYCWGSNSSGQLGNGTTTGSNALSAVAGNLAFAYVSGGRFHTCGLTLSATVYCWGSNADGRLGNGTLDDSSVPVPVLPMGAAATH
jgi:alpha-tubulin suppressor-like RCC1 family protein